MRAVDTYSWLNSFAENEEEGNVSSRRSTPSLGPFPIHCISHRIKEGERGRKAETAWLCYASLAIDFKADRPSVLRIKHEENIFIRITRIFVLRPRATTWPNERQSRISRFPRLRATSEVFRFRRVTIIMVSWIIVFFFQLQIFIAIRSLAFLQCNLYFT